jgi:uncharacterized protein involved in exopolysaccharide biosynthesis
MMARHDRGEPLEIKDYVGALVGRGRIVAAVAIVAGFLAVVVYILQPQRYSSTATVVIPVPPSTTTSAIAAVSEGYADFSGALSTDVVAERAAADAGVPTSTVKGHLSATRLSSGSVAEVTYNGSDKDHAESIAKAGAQEALAIVVAARLDPLDQQMALALTAYTDANDQYRTFIQDSGVYNEQYFIQQQRRIISLQDQLGAAQAAGHTAMASDLQAKIAAKNATISQNRATFDQLTAIRQSALESYTAAQQQELSEKGLLESAKAGGQVSASAPKGASRLAGLIKAVVPAVVVATGLAIALIVLLEVVGPVRLPGRGPSPGEPEVAEDGSEEERPGAEGDGSTEPEDLDDEAEEPERDPAGRRIQTRA